MSNFFDFLMSSYTTIEKIFLLIVLFFILLHISILLSAVFNVFFKKDLDNRKSLYFMLYLLLVSIFICLVCETVLPKNYNIRNLKSIN